MVVKRVGERVGFACYCCFILPEALPGLLTLSGFLKYPIPPPLSAVAVNSFERLTIMLAPVEDVSLVVKVMGCVVLVSQPMC